MPARYDDGPGRKATHWSAFCILFTSKANRRDGHRSHYSHLLPNVLHQNEEMMILNSWNSLLERIYIIQWVYTDTRYFQPSYLSKSSATYRSRSKRSFSITNTSLKEVEQLNSPIPRPLSMSKRDQSQRVSFRNRRELWDQVAGSLTATIYTPQDYSHSTALYTNP